MPSLLEIGPVFWRRRFFFKIHTSHSFVIMTQGCFVTSLVEIGPVVENVKSVQQRRPQQRTTDKL